MKNNCGLVLTVVHTYYIKMSLLTTIDNCVAHAVTLFVKCVAFMSLLNTWDHNVTLSACSCVNSDR